MTYREILAFLFSQAFLSFLSVVISAFISYKVAKSTAASEIDKLQLIWEHENRDAFQAAFAEMSGTTTYYLAHSDAATYTAAVKQAGAVKALADGELKLALDALCNALVSKNHAQIQSAQNKAIEIYSAEKERYRKSNN